MLGPMKARFLAAVMLMLAASPDARAQTAQPVRAPVVVELYSSQGCSQCPRANRLLGELSREPGLIALTFPVGYWDYLGWADTFAQPEFDNRQRAYSRSLRTRAPFTPQLIIDGMRQTSAADWDEARAALDQVQHTPAAEGAPSLRIRRLPNHLARIDIGAGAVRGGSADVWLLSVESGPLSVMIRGGENANRVVSHYNLVRRVWRIGTYTGASVWYERPRCTPECAVLLQEPNGGRIIAAAMTPRERR